MPGISFVYKSEKGNVRPVSGSLDEFKYEPNYDIGILFEDSNFTLSFTGYDGYPKLYFADDEVVILLEGLVYDKSDPKVLTLLKEISRSYVQKSDFKTLIKEFIDNSDGDFIALIYLKEVNEVIVFNDRWGRLPSYYYYDNRMLIFSRELSFLLSHIPSIQFDRASMVEFLSFGYTLGDKTLIRSCKRVSPSFMIISKISGEILNVLLFELFGVNFEEPSTRLAKKDCIAGCKELFLRSIESRVNKLNERKYRLIADISGGFDTRVVMAGLCRFNAKVDYFTDCLVTGDESKYAARVANAYNIEPIIIEATHETNYDEMSRITYITDCTVNGWTALSCYNDSLERRKRVKDMAAKFMGFGGEFIRHPYADRKSYKSLIDMLKDGHFVSYIKIEEACSLVNIRSKTFYDYLSDYFNDYSEQTLRGQVKHLYFEYYNNLVNAGENRHRLHFWTIQPLWSKYLFDFEMLCIPFKYKGYNFFLRFMKEIDPLILDFPIYGTISNFSSKLSLYEPVMIEKFKNILFSSRVSSRFTRKMMGMRKRAIYSNSKELKAAICQRYEQLKFFSFHLDKNELLKPIENELKPLDLYMLMTLILYFEKIEQKFANKMSPQ